MDSNNNLKFIETLTVEQFKAAQNVAEICVKKNPHTGKLFFTYGAKTGAVSQKGVPEHPMVSSVETPKGENFFLLHEEAQGGAEVVCKF